MEKYEEEKFFNKSEFGFISTISGGMLIAYISAAVNQIPNVPENGNLRKEYEHTFEYICHDKLSNKYVENLRHLENSDGVEKLGEVKLIEHLVEIIGTMNKETKYLQLNYQQMLNNRLNKFEISEKRIQEIQEKNGKPITREEKKQLLQVSAMQDVSNYLYTMYVTRLGMKSNFQPVFKENNYFQVIKNNDLQKNLIDLLNAGEKSFLKIINYEKGVVLPAVVRFLWLLMDEYL